MNSKTLARVTYFIHLAVKKLSRPYRVSDYSHKRRIDEILGLNYLLSPRNPFNHILENLNVHESYN
jgi:hypothetical protein